MAYALGILISLAAGFFLLRTLAVGGLNLILYILLALTLGLGIDGTAGFYVHVLLNQFNRFIPVGIVILGGLLLSQKPPLRWQAFKDHIKFPPSYSWGLLILALLALPLISSGHYFPLGGWDAWSCWNLKAKFIFMGQEHWKDMLAPSLWRSNTQYPLLWPLINVWFWDLSGRFEQATPMLNSIVIALLTAGVLLFGIWELTGQLMAAILAAVIVTALPFNVNFYTSQYSDSLLGLYLLSAFVSWLLSEKYHQPNLKVLSMIFLGLMSFTKSEGEVAAVIAALGLLWHQRTDNKKELKNLVLAFIIAALPTIIFTFFIAPKNEAFVNGLVSTQKPTTLGRVGIVLLSPWLEVLSPQWHGFWILGLGGILLAGKKLWRATLGIMGLSLILYFGVVLAYYTVNTYFEIVWWLGQTLARILFALMPTVVLWICCGLMDV